MICPFRCLLASTVLEKFFFFLLTSSLSLFFRYNEPTCTMKVSSAVVVGVLAVACLFGTYADAVADDVEEVDIQRKY